ncbi:translocation and assembly module lipoprotein TamL [Dyadobacter tibetensis]|uniref:translocation and assembly module lipoprotein TamL n=1 Tax=Dyadobacter tibetensis TaxID=1211851 RepID=UPI000471CBCC|nr:BamA/TamA family outer membrane protein [Dyadobacter tibetensis]
MRIKIIAFLLVSIWMSACSIKRFVPEGQNLYVGNSIKVIPDSLTKPSVSGLESSLSEITKPTPNKTIFGFPWKVWWYYFIGEPKDEGGLRSWFRGKLGEPPVIATQRIAEINAGNIEGFLDNEGYYRSTATGKLNPTKKRTATIDYQAYIMPRYVINQVQYVVEDSSTFNKDLVKSKKETYLTKGSPVRLEVISAERSRIDNELKGKGYYYFNPDYLIVKVDSTIGRADSTLGPQQVNLYLELKKETVQTALKQYYIQHIHVNTGTRENTLADSLLLEGKTRRVGIRIQDPGKRYKRRIFYDAISFRPGSMYTNTKQNVSLTRLVNLQNFKFVKNRFELVPRSDSALLDLHYDLSPMKKKSLQTILSASTKSNGLGGSQLDINWKNRNLFKGAEMLTINGYFGFDVQLGGNKIENPNRIGNEYYRYGGKADLSFPRFVIPFFKIRPEQNELLPKTILSLNYENRVQKGFFTTTSIRGDWSYVWSKSSQLEHTLTPISLNFIEPRNINTNRLDDIIFNPNTNPLDVDRYLKILESKYFIAGSAYKISYRPTPKPFSKDQFIINGALEYGGNILSALAPANSTEGDPKEFLGVPIFQYGKAEGEVRYYRTLSSKIKWANRLLAGAVLPYGNSKDSFTPQFLQYFAGGSTGLRAFRARSLGPGAYRPDSVSIAQLGYQSLGDIRLEFNTEFRIKLSSLFNLAVFADAGNIWSFPDADRAGYGESAIISSDFLNQVAVGGGLGLRLDFSFLVFRLDLATPFRKPWYTAERINLDDPEAPAEYKNPWVFNEIRFGSKDWRKENLVLNIAVGLPF